MLRRAFRASLTLLGTLAWLSQGAIALAQDVLVPNPPTAESDFFIPNGEAGDEEEGIELETDRDSFTPATTVVGYRRTIVESAYSFVDNRNVPETHSYPELIARYGMSDAVELRVGWNYEVGGAGSPVSGNVPDDFEEGAGLERESRMLYGTKMWLTQQDHWVPQSAFIAQGFTPTSGEETDTELSLDYAWGYTLSNEWVWDTAIRYSTSSQEEDSFNVWAPSSVLKIPMSERWKGHVEYFGIFSQGRATESVQHFVSPGLHYLINPDLEIGFRVGWGLNEQSPNFFANIGGGVRF